MDCTCLTCLARHVQCKPGTCSRRKASWHVSSPMNGPCPRAGYGLANSLHVGFSPYLSFSLSLSLSLWAWANLPQRKCLCLKCRGPSTISRALPCGSLGLFSVALEVIHEPESERLGSWHARLDWDKLCRLSIVPCPCPSTKNINDTTVDPKQFVFFNIGTLCN